MKKIAFIIAIILLGSRFGVALAAEAPKTVDYGNNPILDSDLDGLTDEGEKQIYHTNPNNPDTDGDGMMDGAEVKAGTNPLDPNDPSAVKNITVLQYPEQEKELWSWYLSRAGGLISFFLLYLSIFFGIAISFPWLKKMLEPIYSYELHRWISVQALIFVFIHSLVLLTDKYLNFSLKDIFVPLASTYKPELVTLGVLGMYLMLALILTSYFRKYLTYRVWRITHFLNIALYAVAFFHAYYLGTDLKTGLAREIFLGLNLYLAGMLALALLLKLKNAIFAKKIEAD